MRISRTRSHARHRLPVVRIEPLLHPSKLQPASAPRICRKRPDVAARAPDPDERLVRHDSLYKYLYILPTLAALHALDAHATTRSRWRITKMELRTAITGGLAGGRKEAGPDDGELSGSGSWELDTGN